MNDYALVDDKRKFFTRKDVSDFNILVGECGYGCGIKRGSVAVDSDVTRKHWLEGEELYVDDDTKRVVIMNSGKVYFSQKHRDC